MRGGRGSCGECSDIIVNVARRVNKCKLCGE